MSIHIHQPGSPLNHFVDHFIYLEQNSFAHSLDRFLPDGNTELIMDLLDKPQYIHHNDTFEVIQSCTRAWVSGVRTQPITIPAGTGNRLIVIAFKKGAAHPFYSFPMNELRDSVVPADLIFGNRICKLREQLLHAHSIPEMFHYVELFLIETAGDKLHANPISACVQHAIAEITLQPHRLNFQRLSDHIGYSQKHFIDLFTRQVGVTPKQYLRIMRFQRAICEVERAISVDWGQLAHQSGFYDQAHLIHDFKQFSGFTPNEYLQRKNTELNYVPVH
jgi:AraC-like DNA-binding protein